jgi:hypothetical protein
MSRKYVIHVLNYVTHAQMSVKNISIWNTVNYVHKHVEYAQKNVVGWLAKIKRLS